MNAIRSRDLREVPGRSRVPSIRRATLAAAAWLSAACCAVSACASAAPPSALAGAWTLVRVDNVMPDGTRTQPYGPDPRGLLVFTSGGRYALQILRAERPRFASGDKGKGTAAENQAAVIGSNSHFGRYAIDDAGQTVTFRIEHAFFPNWNGTEQKRAFRIAGDALTYTVPVTTAGAGATAEVEWRRAR